MANEASTDDPFLPLAFSLYSNPGAYAVLAGAGVSRGAGLPTAWDIVVDLVAQMAEGEEITLDNAEHWYEKIYGTTPTYSDVVNQLALTQTERQALLRKYFEKDPADPQRERVQPSVAHRAVARLMAAGVIRIVLTINFDRLFEQALHDLGIEPTVIATDADAKGLGPLHTVQHCVIHLHGDYLNATSMRNTARELSGYPRNMRALLRQVVSDYGLLVAGWSVQYDPALRDAIAAHYPSRLTMGWVDPSQLRSAAATLIENKKALVFSTTADDALGRLADAVEAMRSRGARHPITLEVAVSRIKRQVAGDHPAIEAHDMLAAEFTNLRSMSALNIANPGDTDDARYESLLAQLIEGCRMPAGCSAAFAYWGRPSTYRYWMPEIERLSRINIRSGTVRLLELPLLAATILFYSAGVAAVASQQFDLLHRLFQLRGQRIAQQPQPVTDLLAVSTVLPGRARSLYVQIANVVDEAISIGAEPVQDALQLFEILRLATQIRTSARFDARIREYGGRHQKLVDGTAVAVSEEEAFERGREIINTVSKQCYPYQAHIFATDRSYESATMRRWGSPVAERLADEVERQGELHPLNGMQMGVTGTVLALKGVSAAVGELARKFQWQALPTGPGGIASGVLPDDLWIDAY